jgi:hypothetical protein
MLQVTITPDNDRRSATNPDADILLTCDNPTVGAENLRDQAIFVNHAPGAIAPLDPELIQIRDAVGSVSHFHPGGDGFVTVW